MKQFAKIICIAALSVAAYGCGGGPQPTTPPDATVVNRPDASSSCSQGTTACGDDCCTSTQKCMANQCVECECRAEDPDWTCGLDSCEESCGSCTDPMVCQLSTHTCKNSGDLCNPNPCGGETPDCNAADGSCKCNSSSCTGGKTCNATSGLCEGGTPACNANQTECGSGATADCCDNATEECVAGKCETCGCGNRVCGEDVCGNKCGTNNGNCSGTDICNANGQCKPAGQLCDDVDCAQEGEECDQADGQCKCTVGGTPCADGFECDATLRKCVLVDLCAGNTCATETPCDPADGLCKCTQTSCGAGKTCNMTTHQCEATVACPGKTCTAEQPCNPTTNNCECTDTSCTSPKTCNATTKACQSPTACEGKTCTAEQPCNEANDECECTSNSCTPGKTCNQSTKACETVATGCVANPCDPTSETPHCDTVSGECQCNSNSCPAGKTCSPTTKVCEVSGGCSGCTSGETCNTTTNTCECTPSTSIVKDSCYTADTNFMCDATTKRCKSVIVTCNGTPCEAGQVCASLTSEDPLDPQATDKECTCLPSLTTGFVNSCQYLGKACNTSGDGNWKCETPTAWDECVPWASPACDTAYNPNLTCEGFQVTGGQTLFFCVQKCPAGSADSNKCQNPWEKCFNYGKWVCDTNYCVDPESTDANLKNRDNYFQPCAAAQQSDGICLPLPAVNAARTDYIDNGFCFQTGTATTTCDPNADRTNLAGICAQGSYCDITQINATKDGYEGVCRKVCNAAVGDGATINPTPATNCDAGSYCVDYSWWFGADSDTAYEDFPYTLFGMCFPECNVISQPCTGSDPYGNPYGCNVYEIDGTGYCGANHPNAGGAGEACGSGTPCTTDAQCAAHELCGTNGECIDFRSDCSGSLVCGSSTNTCVGFCDSTVCTAGATCASCEPSGYKCSPLGTGVQVGICGP